MKVRSIPRKTLLTAAFALAVIGAPVNADVPARVVTVPTDALPVPLPTPITVLRAPEIDSGAGVQAIALLTCMLLLAGERFRHRNG
jgi:hypothetical protein